ncbi:MAG: hypothetical protein GTO18_20010 [Anaerolineales bacterium]|nr:hypothetical protein [Anaerolineales bacterium]
MDISSDFYPELGAYSSVDTAILAQHFAWLRQAGVGTIIISWMGQGSREDQALPHILDLADEYRIKVAFHLVPREDRSAEQLLDDVKFLYDQYGNHPAFYRTQEESRWSPDNRWKGLFFLCDVSAPYPGSDPVGPEYWLEALIGIHSLPDGGLVIANSKDASWIDGGHFDGLYNYTTPALASPEDFRWALDLPPDSWYVPSVMPGFSGYRNNYSASVNFSRKNGESYIRQWEAALSAGVHPKMVTIRSFNEWQEGTQIEPAAPGATNGMDHEYKDYEPLDPYGYLSLTNDWAIHYIVTELPQTYRSRIHMTTSSDWTVFSLISGGFMTQPHMVDLSEGAIDSRMIDGNILLSQDISNAEAGESVELIMDILFTNLDRDGTLTFRIERGHLGMTEVELWNYLGDEPVHVDTFIWSEIYRGVGNYTDFEIPTSLLTEPP